jgi:hypothetical protein
MIMGQDKYTKNKKNLIRFNIMYRNNLANCENNGPSTPIDR